ALHIADARYQTIAAICDAVSNTLTAEPSRFTAAMDKVILNLLRHGATQARRQRNRGAVAAGQDQAEQRYAETSLFICAGGRTQDGVMLDFYQV
ncbi:hypothetical protein, partial [Klebsiella pneumoniae]|uniref:hypothetical protein n=1 Tax=Klebsiella pneumoniae TaxID=573 RepID=UPI00210D619A